MAPLRLRLREFRSPISMRGYGVDFQRLSGEERRLAVARLGRSLMDAVGRVVPVVPVALIAHIFLEQRALTELDLKAETRRLLQRLGEAHVYIPRRDLDYARACSAQTRKNCRCCATTRTRSRTCSKRRTQG